MDKQTRQIRAQQRTGRLYCSTIAVFSGRVSAVLLCFVIFFASVASARELSEARLKTFEKFMVGDDRLRDPVPSVDNPQFIPVSDASLTIDHDATVFVEEPRYTGGVARIYPRAILLHHEVINLRLSKTDSRSITYSPLTGSVVGFKGTLDEYVTSFGTTDQLLNSNRVFYDRATNSRWPQLLGQALSGSLQGRELERFPLVWTTWKQARLQYPDAQVLSRVTGYRGYTYDRDPYGSYANPDSYYNTGGSFFPLTNQSDMYPAKERITGLFDQKSALAIVHSALRRDRAVSIDFGLEAVAAFYDSRFDTIRVFSAVVEGEILDFLPEADTIIDKQTRTVWSVDGQGIEGTYQGVRLSPVLSMDSMWFAWRAFFPYTQIYPLPSLDQPF